MAVSGMATWTAASHGVRPFLGAISKNENPAQLGQADVARTGLDPGVGEAMLAKQSARLLLGQPERANVSVRPI
jgi:hypothetical protein